MSVIIRTCIITAVFWACTAVLFGENTQHTVAKGDTLYSLAKKYGVTVDEIRSLNSVKGNDLYVGQKLAIPLKKMPQQVTYETYTVQAGDTLYSIAKRSDITVEELREINSLSASSMLKTAQKLKIPVKTAAKGGEKNTGGSGTVPLIGSDKDPRTYTKKTGDINLVWPVKASEVLYVSGKISGVALTGAKNEHVTAIRSGTVMFSGIYRGFGQVVFVQSSGGLIYVYTGLDTLSVAKGQQINYGQRLGVIGSDPISGKNLINLMVFRNGNPIDPAKAPRG